MPMKGIEKKFGKAVKARRLKLKLSQEELAELAEVHRTYIGSIELGKTVVSINIASQLAKGLNVSLSRLLKDVENL